MVPDEARPGPNWSLDSAGFRWFSPAGCARFFENVPTSVVRINPDKTWEIVADLSVFFRSNPVKEIPVEFGDFEPDFAGEVYKITPSKHAHAGRHGLKIIGRLNDGAVDNPARGQGCKPEPVRRRPGRRRSDPARACRPKGGTRPAYAYAVLRSISLSAVIGSHTSTCDRAARASRDRSGR